MGAQNLTQCVKECSSKASGEASVLRSSASAGSRKIRTLERVRMKAPSFFNVVEGLRLASPVKLAAAPRASPNMVSERYV